MKNILSLLAILLLALTACVDSKKEQAKNADLCFNDSNIKYKYDSLTFWFIDEQTQTDKAEITLLEKGKRTPLIYTHKKDNLKLTIKNPDHLKTTDTIEVRLKNKIIFKISDFRNTPNYGGKNFLGCSLGEFKIKNKKIAMIDGSILRVY